jgi:hypothetical protein
MLPCIADLGQVPEGLKWCTLIEAVLAVDEGCMRMRCTLVVSARRLPRAGTRKLHLTVHDTCGLGSSHVLWAGSDYL